MRRTGPLLGLWVLAACADPPIDPSQREGDGLLDAGEPRDLAVEPQDLDLGPQDLAVEPQDLAVEPRDLAVEPRDLAVEPRDLAVEPQDLDLGPQDLDAEPRDADPGCPLGSACNPIPIRALPFTDEGDTRDAPAADWHTYACAPNTDEGGGEVVYVLDLMEETTLVIAVDDRPGDGVDVDVHLLSDADPAACVARDNTRIERRVPAGRHFIALDTWVNAQGQALPGPYVLQVSEVLENMGHCAVREEDQEMVWAACDPSLDCFEAENAQGQRARFLRLPTTGPVVKEAHLVTVEDAFAGDWPASGRDGIEAHYALSQAATGYVMARREPWAPEGEGGSEWGQSAFSRPLPVIEEAFYVNMYWRRRPAPGTRMIVSNPANGRAVVAAAGYETGPGSNTAIGGVSEEIHHHLGTNHRSVLRLGYAVDQALPFGPIVCDP